MLTSPNSCTKTIETLRKKKLDHWNANKEQSHAWLSLDMMTEAKAGFRAFEAGGSREVDFIALRQRLAAGATWEGNDLETAIMPRPSR